MKTKMARAIDSGRPQCGKVLECP